MTAEQGKAKPMLWSDNPEAVYGRIGRVVCKGAATTVLLLALGGAIAGPSPPQPRPSLFTQHAQQAGLKTCAAVYPALGAMVVQGAVYDVASMWNKQAPDAHPVEGLAGLSLNVPQYQGPAAGIVFATPCPVAASAVLSASCHSLKAARR